MEDYDTFSEAMDEHIPHLDRRQDSLNDQLRDLIQVANRLGMYDAADFIQKTLDKTRAVR